MDSRLAEIEIKLSWSEDVLEQLSTTVFRQQQQIEKLQMEVRALSQRLQAADVDSVPRDPNDERPPHY